MRRPALAALLMFQVSSGVAIASQAPDEVEAAPPTWQAGERTTDTLRGEASFDDPGTADGVYGRFDSKWELSMGLGAELERASMRGAGRVHLHYFQMAGAYASYASGNTEAGAVGAFGVSLRPLFIPRWSEGMERGPAFLDLALDSLSLEMGPYFWSQSGDEARGIEFSVGAGLPVFAWASGLWLDARYTLRLHDLSTPHSSAQIVLSYHAAVFGGH